jgi:hypothetical protein
MWVLGIVRLICRYKIKWSFGIADFKTKIGSGTIEVKVGIDKLQIK